MRLLVAAAKKYMWLLYVCAYWWLLVCIY